MLGHGCSCHRPWMQLAQSMATDPRMASHAYMHGVVASPGRMQLTKGTGVGLEGRIVLGVWAGGFPSRRQG
eukprot:352470-Chlamydomonas_euryale.AAC.14